MIDDFTYHVILDGAGDPETLQKVMPRCPCCDRMLRGEIEVHDGVSYLAGHVPKTIATMEADS